MSRQREYFHDISIYARHAHIYYFSGQERSSLCAADSIRIQLLFFQYRLASDTEMTCKYDIDLNPYMWVARSWFHSFLFFYFLLCYLKLLLHYWRVLHVLCHIAVPCLRPSVCVSLLRCFMGCVLRCADLALTLVPPSQCRTQAPLAPAKIPQRHICYP